MTNEALKLYHREQLVPMIGLVALENKINPESTLDKIIFLLEFSWSDHHKPTMLVSFGALLVLIFMRSLKGYFRRTWWIERLPEVLLVVVLSTSVPLVFFVWFFLTVLHSYFWLSTLGQRRCRYPWRNTYQDWRSFLQFAAETINKLHQRNNFDCCVCA
jgi:hypothetical protein